MVLTTYLVTVSDHAREKGPCADDIFIPALRHLQRQKLKMIYRGVANDRKLQNGTMILEKAIFKYNCVSGVFFVGPCLFSKILKDTFL